MHTLKKNVPLQTFNTFNVKAKAKYFSSLTHLQQLAAIVHDAELKSEPKLILGEGSNILFTQDFPGLVMAVKFKGRKLMSEDSHYYYVKAQAGENWHNFVNWTLDLGLAGLENLSLIPGTVGAAPIQNIGAYGVELADVFHCLEAIDLHTAKRRVFKLDECQFNYRHSLFKQPEHKHYLIYSVTFRLAKQSAFNLSYGPLALELAGVRDEKMDPKRIAEAVCNIRRRRLPDPGKLHNAGSFFKNPIVDTIQYQALRQRFKQIKAYPMTDGRVKLAAAWMIEHCGWLGRKLGDAGVYHRHALVLVNHGQASGDDIKNLSRAIVQSVKQRFNVELVPEPVIF